MRSFSLPALFFLLLGMCGLCGVQWWRESKIREIAVGLRTQLAVVTDERDYLNERAKAADGEILRLNNAFVELRANSVPKQDFDTSMQALALLNIRLAAQNDAILRQNQVIQQQNEAMQKANATVQRVAGERTELAKKLNEVTTKYNALLKGKGEQ